MINGYEWIIVIAVVVLIFGASRLPTLGRNLGQGIKEFRKGLAEARTDRKAEKKADADKPDQAPEATGQTPPADGPSGDR